MISVVIPVHNRADLVRRAIESVLKQTYSNFEIIVIDDGSDVPLELDSHSKIRLHRIPHSGVSKARNVAVTMARGKYIAFLDSDDEWLPEKLERQMDIITQTDFRLVHTEEIWVRRGKRVNPKNIHRKYGGKIYPRCLPLCCISPSSVLMDKDLFWSFGGFREDFPVCEDYDLWLKICMDQTISFIETPLLVKYGGHEDQLSQKFRAMDYWRILALDSRLNDPKLPEIYREETVLQLIRKCEILLRGYWKHHNFTHYETILGLYRKWCI